MFFKRVDLFLFWNNRPITMILALKYYSVIFYVQLFYVLNINFFIWFIEICFYSYCYWEVCLSLPHDFCISWSFFTVSKKYSRLYVILYVAVLFHKFWWKLILFISVQSTARKKRRNLTGSLESEHEDTLSQRKCLF